MDPEDMEPWDNDWKGRKRHLPLKLLSVLIISVSYAADLHADTHADTHADLLT